MSRPRPRIMLKLGVFLLLGAIANVAVAWGCAFVHGNNETDWSPYQYANQGSHPFVFHVTTRFGFEIVSPCERPGTIRDRYPDRIRTYNRAEWWPSEAVTGFGMHASHGAAAGWPRLSLSTWLTREVQENAAGDGLDIRKIVHSGIASSHDLKRFSDAPRILPLRPIWPGFAINTVFYAAILALLFYGPGKVRRLIRIHRSQCPACGHIIAAGTCANGLCSECGARLPLSLVRERGQG